MATRNSTRLRAAPEAGGAGRGAKGIRLRPSAELDDFLATAAGTGLSQAEAVCLGVERALALADAVAVGLDSETARQRLCAVATGARPRLPLTPAQASRVRGLVNGRPVGHFQAAGCAVVPLPDPLLARARGRVPVSALSAAAVPEMISWEIAATLEGRTMGEWALLVLARTATGGRRLASR